MHNVCNVSRTSSTSVKFIFVSSVATNYFNLEFVINQASRAWDINVRLLRHVLYAFVKHEGVDQIDERLHQAQDAAKNLGGECIDPVASILKVDIIML